MKRERTRDQHVADFLSANGYKPESIVKYLEAIAAAGRPDPKTGKVVIGDTIYNWSEDVVRPHLYEFDKVKDEKSASRPKVWRTAAGLRRRAIRTAPHMRGSIMAQGVNIGRDGSHYGGFQGEG